MSEATDLEKAFWKAVKLFNATQYDELGGMCDLDVIMKKVDDPGSITGIGNLIVYLNTQQKPQRPQFEKVQIDQKIEKPGNGIVIGKGEYLDKSTDKHTIPVHFEFVFNREDEDDDWSLINAFAVPRK
jgi:hypothetical protein